MIPDPLDGVTFPTLMADIRVRDVARSTATRADRARELGRHHRRLLILTSTGRRRLRGWLEAQHGRPIVVESYDDRYRRILAALALYGDVDVLPPIADGLARLPAPVVDFVLGTCVVIVIGRYSAGWASGPLPPRMPIVLDADRGDDAVVATFRHEVAHHWLIDFLEVWTARTIHADRAALRDRLIADGSTRREADRFMRHLPSLAELQASALAVAWGAMPC
jgi:hypothetical protein